MTVYVYNESTGINSFSTEDYGLISGATTSSVDNGLITDPNPEYNPAPSPEDDWYLITVSEILYPFGPLLTLSSGIESSTYSYRSSGQLFKFTSQTLTEKVTFTWVGNGTLFEIGSGLERTVKPYIASGTLRVGENSFAIVSRTVDLESVQLFNISGSLIERQTDSYVGIGTFNIDVSSNVVITNSPAGSGVITISESAETPRAVVYTGIGTLTLSANVSESETEVYVGFGTLPQLFNTDTIYPFVDYTPHYGIDQNIGFGTYAFQLFGTSRDYSNRYPGPGGGLPDNAGIGTLTFDQTRNLARYSPLTPYSGSGLFDVTGTGFESFTRTTYIGLGLIGISSGSIDRKFGTYSYRGIGTCYISEQAVEKETDAYFAEGLIGITGFASDLKRTKSYIGSGSLTILPSSAESISIQLIKDPILFNISGIASESISIPFENVILHQISGNSSERISHSYAGSGSSITLGSSAECSLTVSQENIILFHFATHTSDNVYDSCDSDQVTCDYRDAANVSFVSNPPENTILLNISGSADIRKNRVYAYSSSGSIQITGGFTDIKLSKSESGIGTIFTVSSGSEIEVESYIGSGKLSTLSGDSESYSIRVPQSTILFSIFGTGQTKVELDFSYVGVGTINFSGFGLDSEINTYENIGLGSINISGDPVYRFIPSLTVSGLVDIFGSSDGSFARVYGGSGTFFTISSGNESFARSTYVGLGTFYYQENVGITTLNPFQISRIYTCVI